MAKSRHYYIRRTHRYLGVVLGVQFLFWTISGLYFSWTNIDEIHGDFQHKAAPKLPGNIPLLSPSKVLQNTGEGIDSINTVQIINILQKPYYSIGYFSSGKLRTVLADAETAAIRKPVEKNEAVLIATASFNGTPTVKSIEFITATTGHHEYREKPLPAWAVTFTHPTNTTVYVSSHFGRVESYRNNKWRIFDFLWMTHTMDYKKRDNINNWLLRAFSVFGLLTVLSGFVLYGVSSRKWRPKPKTLLP